MPDLTLRSSYSRPVRKQERLRSLGLLTQIARTQGLKLHFTICISHTTPILRSRFKRFTYREPSGG